tara:strand:+ start:775 stop:2643 length:1869 start_codon:yes stop_codon:yes gene_type:complete
MGRRKSAKTRAANARSRARQRAKATRLTKSSRKKSTTSKSRSLKSTAVTSAGKAIAAARSKRKQVQRKKDEPKLSRNYGKQPATDPTGVGRPTSIPKGARWSKSKNMLVHKGKERKPWKDGTAATGTAVTGKEPTRGKSGQNTRRGSGLKGSISSIGNAQRSRAKEAMVDKFRGGGYQNKAFGMGREQRGYGMQQTPRTMPDFMQGARERAQTRGRESAQNRPNVFSNFGTSNAIKDIMKEKRSTVRRAIDSAKGKPDVTPEGARWSKSKNMLVHKGSERKPYNIPEGARWSRSKNMLVEKGKERNPWTGPTPTPDQPTPRATPTPRTTTAFDPSTGTMRPTTRPSARRSLGQQTAPSRTVGTSSYNPATGRMEYTSTPSNFSRSSQRPSVKPTVNFNPSTGSMERGAPQRPPTTGELGARPQRPQSKGDVSPTRSKGDSAPIQAAPRADVMPRTTARQPAPQRQQVKRQVRPQKPMRDHEVRNLKGSRPAINRRGKAFGMDSDRRQAIQSTTFGRKPAPGMRPQAPRQQLPTNLTGQARQDAINARRAQEAEETKRRRAQMAVANRRSTPRATNTAPMAPTNQAPRQLPSKGSVQSLARSVGPMRKNVGGFKLPPKSQIKK